MSAPTLYALLIGINKYEFLPPMRWLQYCHRDVALVQSYLQEPFVKSEFADMKIEVITEKKDGNEGRVMATKDVVVERIQSHLGQAQPGDTALLYFSGHGVRESTSIATFQEEELDGNIGGLVMHNFGDKTLSNPGQTVLADKEIRYLIKRLTDKGTADQPVHVVVIFDCCHSGESTRSVLSEELPSRSRQVDRGPVRARGLEEFFFCDNPQIKQKIESNLPLQQVLPEGDHVMLAACREVELAWEGAGGNGAFTRGLIDVLRKHQGQISYHELHQRLVNRLRMVKLDADSNDYRQTPQLYLNTSRLSDRYRQFLTYDQDEAPTYGSLEFNVDEQAWRFGVGALHGLPIAPALPTVVQIYPVGRPEDRRAAEVKEVFLSHSMLDLFGFEPDPAQSYRGEWQGVALPQLRIAVVGDQDEVDVATAVLAKRLAETPAPRISLVDVQDDPDYELRAAQGKLQIVEPGSPALARVAPSQYVGQGAALEDAVHVQYEYLNHMAKWTMMRDLEHKGAFLPKEAAYEHPAYPVELRVYEYDPQTQQERILSTKKQSIVLELTPAQPIRHIRFELVNRSPQELFVSLVYMPHTFGFLTRGNIQLMHKAQLGLGPMTDPGSEAGEGHVQSSRYGKPMPNGRQYMAFRSGAYVVKDNWPGMQDYLKLLVSEIPFEMESLHLDMLPRPDTVPVSTRNFLAFEVEEEVAVPQWELQTWSLYITNPHFQPAVLA